MGLGVLLELWFVLRLNQFGSQKSCHSFAPHSWFSPCLCVYAFATDGFGISVIDDCCYHVMYDWHRVWWIMSRVNCHYHTYSSHSLDSRQPTLDSFLQNDDVLYDDSYCQHTSISCPTGSYRPGLCPGTHSSLTQTFTTHHSLTLLY